MSLQQAYPVEYTKPIREQLKVHDVKELVSKQEVIDELATQEELLVLINSVCGCAAANARPALYEFMKADDCPPVATVFAGVHQEATKQLREAVSQPPSSPSFAYFKGGKCVYFMPREEIESGSIPDLVEALSSHIHSHD